MSEEILSLKDHLAKLAELRDDAHDNGKFAAAIAAEVARGKAAGHYTTKHELTVNNEDQLSEGEIRRKLLELAKRREEAMPMLEGRGTVDAEYTEVLNESGTGTREASDGAFET